MRQKLVDFLKLLEKTIPPKPKCHHAITYAQYGSEQGGWQDKLALQVFYRGQYHCFFLEEGDLEKAPHVLSSEIAFSLIMPSAGTEQISAKPLQYCDDPEEVKKT